MICLEMLGYFTEKQPAPSWLFRLLYPDRGDFIVVAGRWADRDLTRRVKQAIRGSGFPTHSFTAPRSAGIDASDQRSYWDAGIPAVMVTDTAFVRNPNYHTAEDTAETLDYRRMARVGGGDRERGLLFDVLQADPLTSSRVSHFPQLPEIHFEELLLNLLIDPPHLLGREFLCLYILPLVEFHRGHGARTSLTHCATSANLSLWPGLL
jgi:peptidase M28-like protein